MADTWLITGIPGAGKTTVSRLLAERFERPVVIRPLVEQLSGVGLWIDNAALAPAETADFIFANRDRARLGSVWALDAGAAPG